MTDKPKRATLTVRVKRKTEVKANFVGRAEVFQTMQWFEASVELTTREGLKLRTVEPLASRGEGERAKTAVLEAAVELVRANGYVVLKSECVDCGHSIEMRCGECIPADNEY
jgi:hypothetical protein